MLRIHVNDPGRLGELHDALARAECRPVEVEDDTLLIAHPLALDEREARLELSFFLKAWQAAQEPAVEAHILD
jgi:hypothetical protein